MKKSMIAIIVALLLVLSLAPAATAFAEGNSNLTIDTLTATIGGEPQTLDPAFAASVDSANYILHMLEGLTTIDRSGKVVPGIAESWDISSDGTVYTFHLRDAEWSDGQAVTADDFVYAWRRVVDPLTESSTAYNMEFVKNAAAISRGDLPASDLGVESLDEGKTLQVTLEAPCGFFLQVVGNTTYMPARSDMISAHSDDWTQSAGSYPSDGPYKLQSWEHESEIVMVKNPNYWNISNITGPKKIVWKLMSISDPDAVHAAYEANELQYASGVPTGLYDSKDLREFSTLGTYYLDFNNAEAPFNDVRVRQAINLVIDRNHIVDEILGGNEPADNFVPKGLTQPDETDFNEEATPAYSTYPVDYAANVTQAKQLLADAGYSDTNPFPQIVYGTNSGATHEAIAAYIQQVLMDELGIDMQIQTMNNWNDFTAARSAGTFDIARDGWLADYGDPYSFLQLFKSGSSGNSAKYSSAAYDTLLEQSNTETNMTTRFQLLQQAQYQLMHEDQTVCPLYYYTQHAAAKPKLNSITNVYSGFTFFFWTVQGRIDTLTATIGAEPTTLDPAFADMVDSSNYILHMLEGLTTIDQSGKVVPGIAESWDISSDGTVYTFHLRDAKWSDGQAVTADDFVYAWQRVIDPATHSSTAYNMDFVKNAAKIANGELLPSELGVEATGPKTLQVTLESPCGFFLQLVGNTTYMPTRSDIITAHPGDWTQSAGTYPSDGPYMLQSWENGTQIVMIKNPNYWNAAYITGPGKIVWKLTGDPNTVHAEYEANDLQYASGVDAKLYESADLKEFPTLGTYYLDFNNAKAPFNNAKVRQAISLVIDRNHIRELVGGNQPADNFVPKGLMQPDGTDFNEQATPAYSIDPADYENSVTQAQALLASAGYPGGTGFPTIDYIFNNNSSNHAAIAEYIKQVLMDELGINMNIQAMDWNSFTAARSAGNFDIARDGWMADYGDPYSFLQLFRSGNSAGYSNLAYNNLLDQINADTDMTHRFGLMQQAQEIVMNQDYAVCPIYYYTQRSAVKPYLSGITNVASGFVFFFWTVQIPESESQTEEGSDVQINNDQASTTITFDNVTESGFTYPSRIENPPAGTYFHLKDSAGYLDITSTADFTGGVTITVAYDPSAISGNESDLRLYQFKEGRPIDITQFVDTENNTITGTTDHFCAFGIGIPATYQIKFETQDGSHVTNASDGNGALISAPQAPTKTGYTFGGWYKELACQNAWSFASDRMPERDLTLYAKWTINHYTVTFNPLGGGAVPGKTANYNTTITPPSDPARPGYLFGGWYKNPDCTNTWNFASDKVTSNTTLYAKWSMENPVGISCSSTNVTIFGGTNGSITVIATGGNSGTYQYSLNSGSWQSSNTFSSLGAGTYVVAVRDAVNTGNVKTGEVTISQPSFAGNYPANKVPAKENAGSQITVSAPQQTGFVLQSVSYSSSNTNIATVDPQGNVVFISGGKVTITIVSVYQKVDSKGNVIKKTTTVKKNITVNQLVQSITLNITDKTLARTATVKLVPQPYPFSATNKKVKWTSSNPKVATVSGAGVVTGKAGGTAIITCTAMDGSNVGASCTVTVTPIYPAGIKLSKTALQVKLGKTGTLKATVSPANTDFKNVSWSSSDPSIAAVNNGKVTGVSPGTATITATTSNGLAAGCSVTIK